MVEGIKVSACQCVRSQICTAVTMTLRPARTTKAHRGTSSRTTTPNNAAVTTTTKTTTPMSGVVQDWMVIVLVVTFTAGCYLNSLHGDFVHDDLVAVTSNPDVLGQTPVLDLFRNDFWGKPMSEPSSHKSYRPLTVLTFRLNSAFWGLRAHMFHVTNVALHAAVVILLMYFCKEVLSWRRDAAATTAILFASHPIHTEAVSSIVGRADVLCCALYLSSLIACSRESLAWQGVSLVCAGLALLAKEQGVTVLGVCLTYHLLILADRKVTGECKPKRRKHSWDMASVFTPCVDTRIIVLFTTMVLLISMRGWMLHGTLPQFAEQDNPAAFCSSWLTRFLTYLYLPAFNTWLLLSPVTLSYDWQMGSIPLIHSLWEMRNVATLSFLVSALALFSRGLRGVQGKERKRVMISLSLMILPFLPASNLLVTVGFVVAERVLYIPSLGFCILVSHGLQRLMQRGPLVAWLCRAAAVVLILLFVLKTVTRNTVWTSRETLFRSGLESVPTNAKVHYNYANLKKDIGDKDTAIKHYRIALSLWPTHASSHNNLGTLLDDPEEAEKHFREALRINPCHAKAHYNLASIYSKRGQNDVAETLLLRAIHLDPEFVAALSALGSLYGEEGRLEEAERLHLWAVTLDPDNADSLNNYGTFLEKSGRTVEAMTQYERAMAVQPNHTVAILNAARSLRSLKHSRRAEELYKRALEIQEDPQIMDNLGVLYLSSGRYLEAKEIYRHLQQQYPQHNESKLHFAQLLIQERSYQQAESLLLSIKISDVSSSREALHLLASLYSHTNRTAEALDSILKALSLCSMSEVPCGRFHAEHGDILKDMNDYESAEESYKLALLLDPNLAGAHLNLAVIYHIRGNYTLAKKHYQEAYNLDSSPQVLLDNMRKLQRRLFPVAADRCWRTDPSCRLE